MGGRNYLLLAGMENVTVETASVGMSEKTRIFNELHAHYVDVLPALEAPNYALRIATMSQIIHTCDVCFLGKDWGFQAFIHQRREDVKTLMMINAIEENPPHELLALMGV